MLRLLGLGVLLVSILNRLELKKLLGCREFFVWLLFCMLLFGFRSVIFVLFLVVCNIVEVMVICFILLKCWVLLCSLVMLSCICIFLICLLFF